MNLANVDIVYEPPRRSRPLFLASSRVLDVVQSKEWIEKATKLIEDKDKHYVKFSIPKRNGKYRVIDAPDSELKEIQNEILYGVLYKFAVHQIAHGFTKSRSPLTNATLHVGARIVIGMDLKDFFPSIKIGRVKKMFGYLIPKDKKYDIGESISRNDLIDILSELITKDEKLPQGAPTSPAFSNLCAIAMDRELYDLQDKYGCIITRYADDITISSDYNILLPSIIKPVKEIIKKHGFRVNNDKTRINRNGGRLMVTGVVVNTKPNIKKTTRRNLRAMLHNYATRNMALSKKEFSTVRGRIEWIKCLNPLHGENLLKLLKKVRLED